jgi:SAM-dependent methyltransferase
MTAILLPTPPLVHRRDSALTFSETMIRRTAKRHGPSNIAASSLRAMCRAWWLRHVRGADFRRPDDDAVRAAYDAMTLADFNAINARQAWANWRTIPRNLSGRIPGRPLAVVDLCCGVGDSSAVLAFYCPPGSRILGLERNPSFVRAARARVYCDVTGGEIDIEFAVQDVLETFRDAGGQAIAPASIDLVHAQGSIGCHFSPVAVAVLAGECSRVVKTGGFAMLDTGRSPRSTNQVARIFARAGFTVERQATSCAFDRWVQLCLRKTAF